MRLLVSRLAGLLSSGGQNLRRGNYEMSGFGGTNWARRSGRLGGGTKSRFSAKRLIVDLK